MRKTLFLNNYFSVTQRLSRESPYGFIIIITIVILFCKTVNCLTCEDGLPFWNLKDEKSEFISKEKDY